MTCSFNPVNAMGSHFSSDQSFSTAGTHERPRPVIGPAGYRPASAPARHHSFILGRSDARLRSLLNQEERDRLHCWSMIVALTSSAAGLTLLLTAALR
ncbi:hypothetical protein [Microvirga sp. 2TAF3]|uniref:hypothetical protein n=1 Tax=Microvirga sp. 2TAF3 TaxID=3233014 RepID=UPI003F99848D